MEVPRNHHSQQTNTGTENQTLHVLTHKWELNIENTRTQGVEQHIPGPVGGSGLKGENLENGSMGAWYMYTYVINLHALHMYPILFRRNIEK